MKWLDDMSNDIYARLPLGPRGLLSPPEEDVGGLLSFPDQRQPMGFFGPLPQQPNGRQILDTLLQRAMREDSISTPPPVVPSARIAAFESTGGRQGPDAGPLAQLLRSPDQENATTASPTTASSAMPIAAAVQFGGYIPGRSIPGFPSGAVEPSNQELRKRERRQLVLSGTGGNFYVQPNPAADPRPPWYESHGASQVRNFNSEIDQVAVDEGLDPDLLKAIMYVETTHGDYYGLGRLADRIGRSGSILPMNIDLPSWGDSFGGRAALNNPINNIRTGAKILRGIIGNVGSPAPISAIATLYNDLGAKKVTDYGARVEEVYKSRPWERPPLDDPGGIGFP